MPNSVIVNEIQASSFAFVTKIVLPPKTKRVIILLMTVLAANAQAKIGETRNQIIRRFGRPVKDDGYSLAFQGKNVALIGFDTTSRSQLEMYFMTTRFRVADADEIIKTVIGFMPVFKRRLANGCLQSSDSAYEVALQNDPGEGFKWVITVGRTGVVAAVISPQRSPSPAPAASVAPRRQPSDYIDPTRSPNDCAIIAAQAYARLKPSSNWCQVIGVHFQVKGQDWPQDHAMVFFKYQPDGTVWVYDERGSKELPTTSTKLLDLKLALESQLAEGVTVTLQDVTH